jgi:predicted MFS family arabinose efflux permease
MRFADEWFTFFPSGALEPIRTDLGLSYAQVGVVVAALSAGGLVGHGFSVAADHVDRRLLAGAGAFVVGLAMLTFALGHAFLLLVLAGLVWGSASDAFTAGCEVSLVQLFPDDLAPVLGRVNAFGALGDLLGPLTLAAIVGLGLGWRWAFGLGAGLMLLYAVVLGTRRFPRPRPGARPSEVATEIVAFARDRQVLRLALIDGLFGLLDEPFQGFTIAYLERDRGLSAPVATAIIGGWVVAGLVGFWMVPRFTARLPARTLLAWFGALVAGSVAVLVFGPLVPLQALAALAFGFGGAVFYAVLQATILGVQPERAGTIGAVVSTIGLFGVAFPGLVGAVVDARGLTAGLALYALVPVFILTLVVRE